MGFAKVWLQPWILPWKRPLGWQNDAITAKVENNQINQGKFFSFHEKKKKEEDKTENEYE